MRGRPFYLELIVSSPGSFHGEGLDLVGADFYFDAVGRAGVVALDDGAADHDVAGQLLELQGIEDRAAAGIDHHGMPGGEGVLGGKLREVIDIVKLAAIERSFQRK